MEKRIIIKDVCLRKSPINSQAVGRSLSACSMHQMFVEIEDDEYGDITDDNQSQLG